MPRKAEGPCVVAGCDNPKRARGYCSAHYQLMRKYGRTDRIHAINVGKVCEYPNCDAIAIKVGYCDAHRKVVHRADPQLQLQNKCRSLWHDRKSAGILCAEWMQFEGFCAGIGEYPGLGYSLLRKDERLPYGPGNFQWISKRKERKPARVVAWEEAGPLNKRNRWRYRDKYRKYGIDQSKYDEMFASQGGVCAICKQSEQRKETRRGKLMTLVVDHCHTTKKVRSLLCWRCNIGLGAACDSIETLQKMIDYLRFHHPTKDFP